MTAASGLEARVAPSAAAPVFAAGERLRLVRLESFEPAAYIAPEHRAAYERRFATLLLDEATTRRGGGGEVSRAVNPRGERFALKRLRRGVADEGDDDASRALRACFDAEYEAHCALAPLRGFPRLFGRALIEGDPVIVMEWVDGVTLEAAARSLAVDDAGRVSPLTAARIGRDLFDLLSRMAYLDGGLAHRDVSPRNVMVDTARLSVADQVEEGSFQLVLVDFGSVASTEGDDEQVSAARPGVRGGAAIDFAAPEMLAEDAAASEALCCSPAVDVYAAAGVLYALLEGHVPYDLNSVSRSRDGGLSAFRLKTAFAPEPVAGAHSAAADVRAVLAFEPEVAVAVGRAAAELTEPPSPHRIRLALATVDDQLNALLAACLAADSAQRPSATDVRDALGLFCSQYADNVARALRGEPLAPCPLGGAAAAVRRRSRIRRGAHMAVRALSAAVALGAAAGVGVLAQGMPAAFPGAAPWWAGPVPGAAVAAAMLLPFAGALLARGRLTATTLGLASGVLGDLLGSAVAGLLVALATWPSPAVEQALYGAIFLAAAAPLPLLVSDRMLTPSHPGAASASAPKRPVLPWGAMPPEDAAALPAGAITPRAFEATAVAPAGGTEVPEPESAYELADEMCEEPA